MEIRVLASGSKGNAYLISDGISSLLIEAGIPFAEIREKLNFRTSEISCCLISHGHQDHCKAVADVMKAGIDVYCSEGTAKEANLSGHRLHVVRSLEQFVAGKNYLVMPFDLQHDSEEPLGFLVYSAHERLLYVTDSQYIKYRFQGLTQIAVECNYSLDLIRRSVKSEEFNLHLKNRIMKNHLSLESLMNFCQANDLSKVQSIHLLHLSDINSDAEMFKRSIQELTGKPVVIAQKRGTPTRCARS